MSAAPACTQAPARPLVGGLGSLFPAGPARTRALSIIAATALAVLGAGAALLARGRPVQSPRASRSAG